MGHDVWLKAKMGDPEAIEILVEKYRKLGYSTAKAWVRRGVIPYDEAVSASHLALMKCIRGSYDPKKNSFATYLVRAVDNEIKMYLRARQREAQIQFVSVSRESAGEDVDLLELLPDEDVDVVQTVEDIMILDTCWAMLGLDADSGDREIVCLMRRLEGYTCDEIADNIGISRSYVSRLSNELMADLVEIGQYIEEDSTC